MLNQNAAKYCLEQQGHDGLGVGAYTHFTSPIRRYVDIIIHRMVKSTLDNSYDWYCKETIDCLIERSNEINRLTKKADRDFKRLDMIYDIESKYDTQEMESFSGTIVGFDIGDDDYYILNIRVWIEKYQTIEKITIPSVLTILSIIQEDDGITILHDNGQEINLHLYQDIVVSIVPYSKEIIFSKKLRLSMIEPPLNDLIVY
jgi:hypothetical protein